MTAHAMHVYEVEFEQQDGGPEPELLKRFVLCAARRLGKIEADAGYPHAGQSFDILDSFEGKYVWEMSPEEFEATPPTQVDLEVVSVDPVEAPAAGATVKVVARVPF